MRFQKFYGREELDFRRALYEANSAKIEARNHLGLGYTSAVNTFTDRSFEEISASLRIKLSPDDQSQNGPASFDATSDGRKHRDYRVERASLRVSGSESINWRELGMTTPPKFQGFCGACWAFVTTAMYESLLLLSEEGTHSLSE